VVDIAILPNTSSVSNIRKDSFFYINYSMNLKTESFLIFETGGQGRRDHGGQGWPWSPHVLQFFFYTSNIHVAYSQYCTM